MSVSEPQLLLINEPRTVKSISSKGHLKRLRFGDGGTLNVHRFACVGTGDIVSFGKDASLFVHTDEGKIRVLPHYKSIQEFVAAPDTRMTIIAQEIVSEDLYDAYNALSEYHYRSQEGFGRRAILVLTCSDLDFPSVLGFIEITSPLMSVKNRSELFDAPFQADPTKKTKWDRWDAETRKKNINLVARISRMVVHPEVRGIGLSKILIHHAEQFCQERWNLKRQRPLFLEITADMLKFMPFVYSAQMHWIGNSPGNADRVAKDMAYLQRMVESDADHWINRPDSKGIATRQRKDVREYIALQANDTYAAMGRDIESDLENVAKLAHGQLIPETEREEFDVLPQVVEWLMPLVRSPKPTYMKGLTKSSEAFVISRIKQLGLSQQQFLTPLQSSPCCESLKIENLTLGFEVDTGILGASDPGVIRRAFGLDRKFKFRTGIKDLSLTIEPGHICYVYGSSGSGKTCLLNMIAGQLISDETTTIEGQIRLPSDAILGYLDDDWPSKPLITAVGAKSLDEAVFALNLCGLAEPRLYLSMWQQLSAGQKYRAQLAKLICSDANVWLLDEFASNLDDATALSVGRNFARAAKYKDVICVIASVRRTPLLNSIEPDITVRLNQVSRPVISWSWRNLAGVK